MDKPFALIVEDEPDTAALYRHVLDMIGYQTEIAFQGQDTVDRLPNSKPDIVILELVLPGVSGKEILEIIRKDDRLNHTKVIVVTAHAHVAESLTAEPDLLLFKPIIMEHFSDLIERFHLKIQYQTTIPIKDEPWDRVTGLYNQSFFENRLNISLRRSREVDGILFAIISINLDKYDKIKAQMGIKHWITILRETAQTLKNTLSPTDPIARFDQNIFYILVENIPDKDSPEPIVARIHKKLAEKYAQIGVNGQIPIQIGALVCDSNYNTGDEILRDVSIEHSQVNETGEVSYDSADRYTKQIHPAESVQQP